MKIQYLKYIAISMLGAVGISGCDLLDITPDNVVTSEKAFSDVDSYQMALNNVYLNLVSSTMNMQSSDFASDDFATAIPGYESTNYYIYNWDYQSQPQPGVWSYQYQLIALENVVIDNYETVPAISTNEQNSKDQIYAQALGMRAWSFFNLVQLYAPRYDGNNGDVKAIPLKTQLKLEYLPQATLKEVYEQIFADLNQATELFVNSDYTPSSNDKLYEFGLNAVYALKARVALFIGDLQLAREASAHFIKTPLLDKENYWMLWEDSFESDNQELIFMTHDMSDTDDADLVDYHQIYVNNGVTLSLDLYKSFGEEDIRKTSNYIGPNLIPYKHIIPVNERHTVADRDLHYKHFRIAEQYLIYAESVLASDPQESLRVLNILKQKRGAETLTHVPDKNEILSERRKELFAEGLRFYDLKRLAMELNLVVNRDNGKTLAPNSNLYTWDIPITETNSNPYIN